MKLKVWATALALCVAFAAGYRYSAALYGADIAALREDYATRAQSLEVKYREKERGYAQSLVDAWEARDKALARVDDLGADLERVRKQAADARSRLSATGAGTCDAEREILALILSGCASKQPTLAVDCPQPVPVPATLKESSLPG